MYPWCIGGHLASPSHYLYRRIQTLYPPLFALHPSLHPINYASYPFPDLYPQGLTSLDQVYVSSNGVSPVAQAGMVACMQHMSEEKLMLFTHDGDEDPDEHVEAEKNFRDGEEGREGEVDSAVDNVEDQDYWESQVVLGVEFCVEA